MAITLVRLWVLWATPFTLGPDEAQYWGWGQSFEWGYFSKPPLVGWAAGLASLVGPDTAFGVRWPSPLLHAIGAVGVWAFAGRAFSPLGGRLAGALYLLAPGITVSSLLISTDALMLPLLAWGLYAVQRLRELPQGPRAMMWGALAGALFGLAVLGKYAALYVVGGLVLGAVLDAPLRRALLSWGGAVLAVSLVAVITPNLVWNAEMDGATIRHTVGNASLDQGGLNLQEPIAFLLEQFGIFGLLVWPAGLLVCLAALLKPGHPARPWVFAGLLPILVVTGVAALSRANANWGAAGLPVLAAVAGAWVAGLSRRKLAAGLVAAALGLQVLIGGLLAAAYVQPAFADRLGLTATVADIRGWPETATAVEARARALGAGGVVVDSRGLYHGLQYSGRKLLRTPDDRLGPACLCDETRLPLRTYRVWNGALNHAEGVGGLQPGTGGVWLLVSERKNFHRFFREDFSRIEPAGSIAIPLGPKRTRQLDLFLVEGVKPVTRTRAQLLAP